VRRTLGKFGSSALVAALVLSLGVSIPAGVAIAADGGAGKIEFGSPADVTTTSPATSGDVEARAVGCALNTANHNRTSSCSYRRIPVTFTVNGKTVGTATLYSKATAELNPRNRYEWKQKVELRLENPSSPDAWTVSATVNLACRWCEATSGGGKALIPYTTQTFEMTVKSPGQELREDSVVPYGLFKAPRYDDGEAALGPVFRPRCDSTPRITDRRYGGCVYPDVPPIWQLDVTDARVDAVAWHVDWAQRNLKHPWGVPGTKYPLHRTTDQALMTANRNTACGRDVPRPPKPGLSCDEYPFAQTQEGASKNPDYSCHFLDAKDNSREGSLRKAFLNGMRVLDGDAFSVEVTGKSKRSEAAVSPRGPVGCGSD
jgi:hypothetical protein